MTKKYRTKELSEMTSVTVRTLHYYDEINLLKPNFTSHHGHRYYSDDDIFRLQQITTLKFFGFSLDKIREIISSKKFDIKESLRTQAKMVAEEVTRLNQVSKLLTNLTAQLDSDQTLDWKTIAKITEVIQMGELTKQEWYEKYLCPVELYEYQDLMNRFPTAYWEESNRRWQNLFKEIEINLNTSPSSDVGFELAKKWLSLVNEIYPESSALRKKLWNACKAGVYPEISLKPEVINYISKAIESYKRGRMNF